MESSDRVELDDAAELLSSASAVLAALPGVRERFNTGTYGPSEARAVIAELRPHALASTLSVALDSDRIDGHQAEAFARACLASMQVWNHSLQGLTELVAHSG